MNSKEISIYLRRKDDDTLSPKSINPNSQIISSLKSLEPEILINENEKLIYEGKCLDLNNTWNSYSIESDSIIDITTEDMSKEDDTLYDNSEGTAIEIKDNENGPNNSFIGIFTNVKDEKKIVVHQISKKKVPWRKVLRGLNLYGICHNYKDKCKACDKEVIHPFQFKTFNLSEWKDGVECPFCKKNFKPVKCGFLLCKYEINGQIINEKTGVEEEFTETRYAKEKEIKFYGQDDEIKLWKKLIIKAFPLN